jgi:hypothetical protein
MTEEQIHQNEYRKVEDHVKEVIRSTNINYSPYYHVLPELINQRGYEYGIELGVFTFGHSQSILDKTNIKLVIGIDPYKEYPSDAINMGTIVSQTEFDILYRLVKEESAKYSNRFELFRMSSDEGFKYITETDKYIDELYFTLMNKTLESKDKFDFFFADGLHTADQLQRDLYNYSQLINKGGICAGHDIDHGTFPFLTPVIENFAKVHSQNVIRGPFHSWYIEKNWD